MAIIHLTLVAIDALALLIVIRFLSLRWPTRIILTCDRIGTPVVDPMMRAVGRAIPTGVNRYGVRWRMLAAVVLLFAVGVCRLALTTIGTRVLSGK